MTAKATRPAAADPTEGAAHLLEDVAKHLEAKDLAAAFDAALDAWRLVRAHELAELCEDVSALIAKLSPPVSTSKKTAERMVAWVTAFRDHTPAGLGRLLAEMDALVASAPSGTGGVQPRFVFPRADALSLVQDDPRVGPVMLRALAVINGGSKWQKVMRRYFRAFEASGDPRTIAGLEDLLANNAKKLACYEDGGLKSFARERGPEVLALLRKQFPDGVPALPEALGEPLHRARTLLRKIKTSGEAIAVATTKAERAPKDLSAGDPASLLADVYANPEDDALRMVLADALTDRGDPRGELIVLQVRRAQGESNRKTIAREKQIVKAHLRDLLGPLANIVVLKSVVFGRGFLEECELQPTSAALVDLHSHYPEWATVKKLRFPAVGARVTEVMTSLREVGPLDRAALDALAATGHPRLERIEIDDANFLEDAGARNAFASSTLFPSLRSLVLRFSYSRNLQPKDFAWIWSTPWGPQLTSLQTPGLRNPEQWIPQLVEHDHVKQLDLEIDYYAHATITRSAKHEGELDLTLAVKYHNAKGIEAPEYYLRLILGVLQTFGAMTRIARLEVVTNDVTFNDAQRTAIRTQASAIQGVKEFVFPWPPLILP